MSGLPETVFRGVSTDSRSIKKGNLFVALKGDHFDGHDYAESVFQEALPEYWRRMMKKYAG